MLNARSSRPWLRAAAIAALMLMVFAALVAPSALGAQSDAGVNVVANPGFEGGVANWACKNCTLRAGTPAQSGTAAGQLLTTNRLAQAQLTQKGLSLLPHTQYELSFWAKSTGQNLIVALQRQTSPFTGYGLSQSFDVTGQWQQFTATFTTANFDAAVSDARLRFRTPKGKGFAYSIDDVSLVALGEPPAPTPSPTPPAGGGAELLVFDWNKPVTTADHGFPWDKPPMAAANGNWMTPINYAEGTLYLRAEIFNMPVPQDDMRLQFCIWQNSNQLENCTRTVNVLGEPGTVVEWSVEVQKLWKKDGAIIRWDQPRHRNGIAIKKGNGDPVSDYSGWNWNGENPADWYPMNARFTVVVVEKGKTFSGWDTYIP